MSNGQKERSKSRMGDIPVNLSILQSTTAAQKAQPEGIESEPDVKGEKLAMASQTKPAVTPKALSSQKNTTLKTPAKQKGEAPSISRTKGSLKEAEVVETNENPFGYDTGFKWPLIEQAKPYLVNVAGGEQGRAGAVITIRMSLEMDRTLQLHLAKLGMKNTSEWIREALARQLELEQQFLSKKQPSR
jgi:hypothetical protein